MGVNWSNKSAARGAMFYVVVRTYRLPPGVNPILAVYIRITYRTFHGMLKFRFTIRHDIKKAWNHPLSIPRTEALALPIAVEQTTSEPTPI